MSDCSAGRGAVPCAVTARRPSLVTRRGGADQGDDAEARIVAVLRNPVDRAYAKFLQMRRDRQEPLASFADAGPEPVREGSAGRRPGSMPGGGSTIASWSHSSAISAPTECTSYSTTISSATRLDVVAKEVVLGDSCEGRLAAKG